MTLEERILKLKDSQVGWFDGYELRVIAEDVCNMEKRIKRLEDRIHRAAVAFFRDGSDGQVASGMLAILEEESGKP